MTDRRRNKDWHRRFDQIRAFSWRQKAPKEINLWAFAEPLASWDLAGIAVFRQVHCLYEFVVSRRMINMFGCRVGEETCSKSPILRPSGAIAHERQIDHPSLGMTERRCPLKVFTCLRKAARNTSTLKVAEGELEMLIGSHPVLTLSSQTFSFLATLARGHLRGQSRSPSVPGPLWSLFTGG